MSRRPLVAQRVYHFNIIYNHAWSPLSRTDDTDLAIRVTTVLAERLELRGYVNSYYYDRDHRTKANFTQELERVLNGSSVTILLVTPGFIHDCLDRYLNIGIFKRFLAASNTTQKLITLSLGVPREHVPDHLTTSQVFYFQEDWEVDISTWSRFDNLVGSKLSGSTSKENWPTGVRKRKEHDKDSIYGLSEKTESIQGQHHSNKNEPARVSADVPDTRDLSCKYHMNCDCEQCFRLRPRTFSYKHTPRKTVLRDEPAVDNPNKLTGNCKQINYSDSSRSESAYRQQTRDLALPGSSQQCPSFGECSRHNFENMHPNCDDRFGFLNPCGQNNDPLSETLIYNKHSTLSPGSDTTITPEPITITQMSKLYKMTASESPVTSVFSNKGHTSYFNNSPIQQNNRPESFGDECVGSKCHSQTQRMNAKIHGTCKRGNVGDGEIVKDVQTNLPQEIVYNRCTCSMIGEWISHCTRDIQAGENDVKQRCLYTERCNIPAANSDKQMTDIQKAWIFSTEYNDWQSVSAHEKRDIDIRSRNIDFDGELSDRKEIQRNMNRTIYDKVGDWVHDDVDSEIFDDLARRTAANLRKRPIERTSYVPTNRFDKLKSNIPNSCSDNYNNNKWISYYDRYKWLQSDCSQSVVGNLPATFGNTNISNQRRANTRTCLLSGTRNWRDLYGSSHIENGPKDVSVKIFTASSGKNIPSNDPYDSHVKTGENKNMINKDEVQPESDHRNKDLTLLNKKSDAANVEALKTVKPELISDIFSNEENKNTDASLNLSNTNCPRASGERNKEYTQNKNMELKQQLGNKEFSSKTDDGVKQSSPYEDTLFVITEQELISAQKPAALPTINTTPEYSDTSLHQLETSWNKTEIYNTRESPECPDQHTTEISDCMLDHTSDTGRSSSPMTTFHRDLHLQHNHQADMATHADLASVSSDYDIVSQSYNLENTREFKASQYVKCEISYTNPHNGTRYNNYNERTHQTIQNAAALHSRDDNLEETNNADAKFFITNPETQAAENSTVQTPATVDCKSANTLTSVSDCEHSSPMLITSECEHASNLKQSSALFASVSDCRKDFESSQNKIGTYSDIECIQYNTVPTTDSEYTQDNTVPTSTSEYSQDNAAPISTSEYSQDNAVPTSTSEYSQDNAVPTSTSEYSQDNAVPTSTSEYSQDNTVPTSTSEYSQDNAVPTSTSEYSQDNTVPTSTSEYSQDNAVPTSTSEYSQDNTVPTSNCEFPQDNIVPTSESVCPQYNTVSALDSVCPLDNTVSALDSVCPQYNTVSASDSACPLDNVVSTSDNQCPQDNTVPTLDSECRKDNTVPGSDSECIQDNDVPTLDSECRTDNTVPGSDSECTQDNDVPTLDSECRKDNTVPGSDSECTQDNDVPTLDSECLQDNTVPGSDSNCTQDNTVPTTDSECTQDNIPTLESGYLQDNTVSTLEGECPQDNTVATSNSDCKEDNYIPTLEGECLQDNDAPTIEGECLQDNDAPTLEGECLQDNIVPTLEGECLQDNIVPTLEGECLQDNDAPTLEGECLQDNIVPTLEGECLQDKTVPISHSECTQDNIVPGSDSECTQDNIVPGSDSECTQDNTVPGSDSECLQDNTVPTSDSECTQDNIVPTLDSECTQDKTVPTSDSECTQDNIVPTSDSECTQDNIVPTLDSECPQDKTVPTSDSECTQDNTVPTTDSECIQDMTAPPSNRQCAQNSTAPTTIHKFRHEEVMSVTVSTLIDVKTDKTNTILACKDNNVNLASNTSARTLLSEQMQEIGVYERANIQALAWAYNSSGGDINSSLSVTNTLNIDHLVDHYTDIKRATQTDRVQQLVDQKCYQNVVPPLNKVMSSILVDEVDSSMLQNAENNDGLSYKDRSSYRLACFQMNSEGDSGYFEKNESLSQVEDASQQFVNRALEDVARQCSVQQPNNTGDDNMSNVRLEPSVASAIGKANMERSESVLSYHLSNQDCFPEVTKTAVNDYWFSAGIESCNIEQEDSLGKHPVTKMPVDCFTDCMVLSDSTGLVGKEDSESAGQSSELITRSEIMSEDLDYTDNNNFHTNKQCDQKILTADFSEYHFDFPSEALTNTEECPVKKFSNQVTESTITPEIKQCLIESSVKDKNAKLKTMESVMLISDTVVNSHVISSENDTCDSMYLPSDECTKGIDQDKETKAEFRNICGRGILEEDQLLSLSCANVTTGPCERLGLTYDRMNIASKIHMNVTNTALETCGEHSQTCGEHSQTCGEHSQTCGEHSQTCGEHSQTCGEHSQTCGEHSQSCGEHSQVPEVAPLQLTEKHSRTTEDESSKMELMNMDGATEREEVDWKLPVFKGVCHVLSTPDMPYLG